eukprot:3690379-Rhodomonas_salina.1
MAGREQQQIAPDKHTDWKCAACVARRRGSSHPHASVIRFLVLTLVQEGMGARHVLQAPKASLPAQNQASAPSDVRNRQRHEGTADQKHERPAIAAGRNAAGAGGAGGAGSGHAREKKNEVQEELAAQRERERGEEDA